MGNKQEKLEKFFYKDIWQVLKENSDITDNRMIASKTSLELAIGLGLIGSPIAVTDIAVAGFSVVGLATKGIKFYQENTEEESSLEEYILIGYRLAYIESFENILKTVIHQPLLEKIGEAAVSQTSPDIKERLGFELQALEPKKAIDCFRETKIAEHFHRNFVSLLKTTGLTPSEANTLGSRVTWNTQRYMDRALTEISGLQTRCIGFQKNVWRKKLAKYQMIDDYLELHIAKESQEKIFTENFTFQDIYVPLKAQPLDNKGQADKQKLPVDLETWVINILQDPKEQDKVIFIQAEAGQGKTVFCQVFSDQVRQNLYPIWTPVLIRLRDIKKVKKQFEDTLKTVINKDFFTNDDDWLTDKNTRYLFLLDGFDELLLQDRASSDLVDFIKQVAAFQSNCQKNPIDKGHRVLITGQNSGLQSIERNLPTNLARVKILPMDNQIQKQWLNNWSAQVGADRALGFQQFLQDKNCPNIVQELAQEPLLLYLLAAIHRDGDLTVEMFASTNGTQAKIKIYQQALKWVFPEQKDSVELIHKSFSEFLFAVRLKASLEQWIKPDIYTNKFQVPQNIMDSEIYDLLGYGGLTPEIVEYLMSLLTTEFTPNSCEIPGGLADEVQPVQLFRRLEDFYQRWCEGEFIDTHEKNFPQKKSLQLQLQNTGLGQRQVDIYVGLNVMILLLELHRIAQGRDDLKTKIIFNLSDTADTRNHWKFQLLRIINYSNLINPRTFNSIVGQFLRGADFRNTDLRGVYLSGANLRGADLRGAYLRGADLSNTHLSGADLSDADLSGVNLKGAHLRGVNLNHARLMGADLSESDLRGADFSNIDLRGAYLRGADLRSADLSNMDLTGTRLGGANLNNANLSNANLSSTDLRGAQLNSTHLREVYLSNADLRGANLSNADLRGAQLNSAHLRGAHLRGTHISNADLSGADLRGALLREARLGDKSVGDIRWNKYTKWEGVRGWKTAHNVPEALKQQLGLEL